ncbi:hypothetical protein A2U01_0019972 [Trifolium medium]|uniref:Uncharacterized protein n=1 Tax=Trifolium medium TaxID=97028 RepID=A0A392NHV9_9FABA|nr:hypothetical protein [Trifolium medium]
MLAMRLDASINDVLSDDLDLSPNDEEEDDDAVEVEEKEDEDVNIQDMFRLNWDDTLAHSFREGNFSANFLAKLHLANDSKITI